MSSSIKLILCVATVLTLLLAVGSAIAVNQEPTVRAEDSSYVVGKMKPPTHRFGTGRRPGAIVTPQRAVTTATDTDDYNVGVEQLHHESKG